MRTPLNIVPIPTTEYNSFSDNVSDIIVNTNKINRVEYFDQVSMTRGYDIDSMTNYAFNIQNIDKRFINRYIENETAIDETDIQLSDSSSVNIKIGINTDEFKIIYTTLNNGDVVSIKEANLLYNTDYIMDYYLDGVPSNYNTIKKLDDYRKSLSNRASAFSDKVFIDLYNPDGLTFFIETAEENDELITKEYADNTYLTKSSISAENTDTLYDLNYKYFISDAKEYANDDIKLEQFWYNKDNVDYATYRGLYTNNLLTVSDDDFIGWRFSGEYGPGVELGMDRNDTTILKDLETGTKKFIKAFLPTTNTFVNGSLSNPHTLLVSGSLQTQYHEIIFLKSPKDHNFPIPIAKDITYPHLRPFSQSGVNEKGIVLKDTLLNKFYITKELVEIIHYDEEDADIPRHPLYPHLYELKLSYIDPDTVWNIETTEDTLIIFYKNIIEYYSRSNIFGENKDDRGRSYGFIEFNHNNFVNIIVRGDQAIGITSSNEIYVCGVGAKKLGLGDNSNDRISWTNLYDISIDYPLTVIDVAFTENLLGIVLFDYGSNRLKILCAGEFFTSLGGDFGTSSYTLAEIDPPGSPDINTQIAIVKDNIILNVNGDIYGIGKNENNELGIDNNGHVTSWTSLYSISGSKYITGGMAKGFYFINPLLNTARSYISTYLTGSLAKDYSNNPDSKRDYNILWVDKNFTYSTFTRFGRLLLSEGAFVFMKNDDRLVFQGTNKNRIFNGDPTIHLNREDLFSRKDAYSSTEYYTDTKLFR
jgi:hypothetical protein